MAYTKDTLSQRSVNLIIFSVVIVLTIIGLAIFVYMGVAVDGFAARVNSVMQPIAHTAIAVGIVTFVVSAYQQSQERAAEKIQRLDALNQPGVLAVERLFMEQPVLAPLYRELYMTDQRSDFYPKVVDREAEHGDVSPERAKQLEYHMLMYLVQVMENVYSVGDLENNYAASSMEGWMNTFRLWSRSYKFRMAWKHNKHLYSRAFREWVDIVIYNDIDQ